ncbi:MAG: outer membrane beta-barrel protein [Owenweeksia sp.]|nr:outer membrane beta-barrel protein [Owenweeksia sp.]
MKRALLIISMISVSLSAQAQFKLGVNVGLPVNDLSKYYSTQLGADAYYMFGDPDNVLQFGVTAGYMNFLEDDAQISNNKFDVYASQYIPAAVVGRITILDLVILGPDIGYAFGIDQSDNSGFYYRGMAGLKFGAIELGFYYLSLANEITLEDATGNPSSLGVSLCFDFGD